MVGRPKGSVNDTTREAKALLRERAKDLVDKALVLCEDVRNEKDACPLCGRGMPRPEELRLKAIQTLLDRAGVEARSSVKVEQTVTINLVRHLTLEEKVQVNAIFQRAMDRANLSPEVREGMMEEVEA
jgi:hypothetical protein